MASKLLPNLKRNPKLAYQVLFGSGNDSKTKKSGKAGKRSREPMEDWEIEQQERFDDVMADAMKYYKPMQRFLSTNRIPMQDFPVDVEKQIAAAKKKEAVAAKKNAVPDLDPIRQWVEYFYDQLRKFYNIEEPSQWVDITTSRKLIKQFCTLIFWICLIKSRKPDEFLNNIEDVRQKTAEMSAPVLKLTQQWIFKDAASEYEFNDYRKQCLDRVIDTLETFRISSSGISESFIEFILDFIIVMSLEASDVEMNLERFDNALLERYEKDAGDVFSLDLREAAEDDWEDLHREEKKRKRRG